MRGKVRNCFFALAAVIFLMMAALSGGRGNLPVFGTETEDCVPFLFPSETETGGESETFGKEGESGRESETSGKEGETGGESETSGKEGETGGESETSGKEGEAVGESEASGKEGEAGGESEASGKEGEAGGESEASGKEGEVAGEREAYGKEEETGGGSEAFGKEGETGGEKENTERELNGENQTNQGETGTEGETVLTEEETEIETETETEPETEGEEEHFLEDETGTEHLDPAWFVSERLVVLASDPEVVIDPEHLIAHYGEIYLLQYRSVKQTMNAYVYYSQKADAAEPDQVVGMASEAAPDTDIGINISEERNPIAALLEESGNTAVGSGENIIALIDTGAGENTHVTDRVSFIDEKLEGGNRHANDMVSAIVSQNDGARILSIRALGDDGRGTVSSITASIEYAIEQRVKMINLSMCARRNLLNSVLETEMQKAVDCGILVVGSAGNEGEDAAGYLPGCVSDADIIGACDERGVRLKHSNYGNTVDYNVVAGSTSEAAAKFSGFVSAHGRKEIGEVLDRGMIYRTDYEASGESGETEELPSGDLETDREPVIYVSNCSDCEITLLGNDFSAGNIIRFTVRPAEGMEIAGVCVSRVLNSEANPGEDDLLPERGDVIQCDVTGFSKEGVLELAFSMPGQDVLIEAAVQTEEDGVSAAEDLLADIASGKFTGWGTWCRCPAAYGNSKYGTTKKSMIVYDSSGNKVKYLEETGYCVQSSKSTPNINAKGSANELTSEDEQALAKALFYLRGGPGYGIDFKGADGKTYNFKNNYFTTASNGSTLTANEQYYMTHVTISYLWYLYCKEKGYDTSSWNWNAGVTKDLMSTKTNVLNAEGRAFVTKVVNALKQMTFPSCKVSKTGFSRSEVILDTASGKYRTPAISYTSIWENSMAISIPTGISAVITASRDSSRIGRVYSQGQTATVYGGEEFRFEAAAGAVTGEKTYSGNIRISGDFAGYSFRYSGDHQDLAFGFSNGNNTFTFRVDWPETAFVKIRKTDSSGGWNGELSGTQFTLYDGTLALETVTVAGEGYTDFTSALTLGKTYTIKETKVPAGYIAAGDLTIVPQEAKNYSFDVANVKRPSVSVTKSSAADAEILELSGYSVENAEFGIYTEQSCVNKIGTLITDASGKTKEFLLPCSSSSGSWNYYVREDKAPAGHKQSEEVKVLNVTLPSDGGVCKTLEFSDDPAFSETDALVQKLDIKGNSADVRINGPVIFVVRFYDSDHEEAGKQSRVWYLQTDEDGKVCLDERHKVTGRQEYVSDPFFHHQGKIVIPRGYLTIQEVEAPPEYCMDTAVYGWNTAQQSVDMKLIYNDLKLCRISIRKYRENGRTPLEGAVFELKFVRASVGDADRKKEYSRLLKEGETITCTTNRDGEAVFEQLDQGEYQITEVSTVKGQTLLKDPITVTLPFTMTQEETAAQKNIDIRKGELYDGVYHFMEVLYEVTNTSVLSVPMTGGSGEWKYGWIGMGMMGALAAGILLSEKKQKIRKI